MDLSIDNISEYKGYKYTLDDLAAAIAYTDISKKISEDYKIKGIYFNPSFDEYHVPIKNTFKKESKINNNYLGIQNTFDEIDKIVGSIRVGKRKKYMSLKSPLYKLKCNLGSRTSNAFRNKGYPKKGKTREMLGVDWEVCKAHIERQFAKGMNWDNHGDWHIDHIIPLASAKTEEELIKLCHYSNLQPLWAEENLSKNDKIIETQVKLRI